MKTYKHIKGYLCTKFQGKYHLAHRVVWYQHYGEWPKQIDHINHDKTDNRIENLREVTNMENHQNKPLQKNNKSGLHGVWWDKARERWATEIKVLQKKSYLGRFDHLFEAACARKSAELKHGFHFNHGG